MDSAQPIYKYLLRQNRQVVDLITHGQSLNALNDALKPYINQYIGDKWRVAGFINSQLTLIVTNAESANRLRFQTTQILRDMPEIAGLDRIKSLQIRVAPFVEDTPGSPISHKGSALKPSKSAQAHLESLAHTIDDPGLRASLLRLARRFCP